MKKFFNWFKKDDTIVLKVLPCCWIVALFMGGAESFQDGFNLDAVLTFLMFLFCGLLFWAFFVALPWTIQDKKKPDGTPKFTNGLMLVGEAVVLVVITMWVGGYI